MTHKGTVPIRTARLLLRRFTPDDAQMVFDHWMSDPEVSKYARQQSHTCAEETRAYLNGVVNAYPKADHYYWAVTPAGSGEPIGRINITSINEAIESVCISYMIGRKWWNQGYITEALLAVMRFFFEEVGANRMEGRCDVQNPASEKVMIKCGFQYEGLLRQGGRNSFGLVDCKQYAILAGDYFAGRSK